jgi:hypothetical protein
MNCKLTPASQRSPFHATTINMAGTLLCVFTTLAVLVSISRDQSGATIAEVTNSFNGSLHDHGRNDVAVIAAAFRQAVVTPDHNRADKSRSGVTAPRNIKRIDESWAASEEDETEPSSLEKLRPTDVNGPMFSHLITELQRYCRVSPSVELGGQLALDLHSQIPQSEDFVRNSIARILKTCCKANVTVGQSPAEFEVVVWASTPATDALVAASQEAFAVEQSLAKSWKVQTEGVISVSSSGRIWTRPNSPRPLATVIVRAAKRQAVSDIRGNALSFGIEPRAGALRPILGTP